MQRLSGKIKGTHTTTRTTLFYTFKDAYGSSFETSVLV